MVQFVFIATVFILSLTVADIRNCCSSKVYVVYMGSKKNGSHGEFLDQDHKILAAVHGGSKEKAEESHVYTYSNGFRGFAAKLTEEQASMMAGMSGVVSVFPNEKRNLHTTHSWDFMGLNLDAAAEIPGFSTENQGNVIIGFIDTGIWPESPSFNDEGMPPVPSRWMGKCQAGESFLNSTCNRKIIGARYYADGYEAEKENLHESQLNAAKTVEFRSPRDSSGHGSHTASTAAGRFVDNMNYNGLASGEARGGAPLARIAVYKACWKSGCYDADLLAAFNDAISDGVDIISLSLGPAPPQGEYFSDAISIGSFHAMSNGIIVVASGGNAGSRGSVTNLAPWMLTVAASSTDRDFVSNIKLGSGFNLMGESLNTHRMNSSVRTMAASEANAGYFTPYQSSYCLESSLNRTKARGKVLVCRYSGTSYESRIKKSMVVKEAGGVGMILIDDKEDSVAVPFIIPAASIERKVGDRLLSFLNKTRRPASLISPAKTVLGLKSAPRVLTFSSKGPNLLTPEILKPDIMAPGLNILAAWSPLAMGIKFNIISGTSMACPHVTGLVALIKSVYPTWSPAAIKSAVMTTATTLNKNRGAIITDPDGKKANPFDYGAGFPVPANILNPGLIYDARPSDYKDFLCSVGYNDKSLQQITGDDNVCSKSPPLASNLNYPSIAVPNIKDRLSITRTLTNVGKSRSVYRVAVYSPSGINVTVVPKFIFFTSHGQKMNFTLNFRVEAPLKGYAFGSLSWVSAKVRVTSPFVVGISSHRIGMI